MFTNYIYLLTYLLHIHYIPHIEDAMSELLGEPDMCQRAAGVMEGSAPSEQGIITERRKLSSQ